MSIESRISYELNKHPAVKKMVKRVYQRAMYTISPKIQSEGNINRISPNDNKEYFFGYYDKSPWDSTGKYMLCMKANNTWDNVSPKEKAEILLIDTEKNEDDEARVKIIGETNAWNVQQACMLQWLGPDFSSRILYNDYRDGKYVSVILKLDTMEEKVIPAAVYSVSDDGKFALTLDFSRLYELRPGYGYYNVSEETKGIALPDTTAIWKVNLETGKVNPVLKYTDFSNFKPRTEMKEKGSVHKVNHIMLSPNGKRFMVLYRWFCGQRKYTRLVTCNVDGTDMYVLSDDDMVSHCCWKNNEEILAFENKKEGGQGYYLMKDRTQIFEKKWEQLSGDGHPSYSPDGTMIVTDSYPNKRRISEVRILKENYILPVARVFAPFKYDNDTRCDLHPRWSRDGKKICFDSVFEGHRGLYTVNAPCLEVNKIGFKGKETIVYLMTGCKKRGPVNQTLNIIKNLDLNRYKPVLLTLYGEVPGDSMIDNYLPHVYTYISLSTSLKKIMMGDIKRLYKTLDELKPVAVHSVGLVPSYCMLKYHKNIHCTTIRNDIYTDYPAKFGKKKGYIMRKLNEKVIKECSHVYMCSKSLSNLYKERMGRDFPYIRNGVDTNKFEFKANEKRNLRSKLGLPTEKRIIVYTGAFVGFKDQRFAIEGFLKSQAAINGYLVLLGNGPLFNQLKNEFAENQNVKFAGFVSNVNEFLEAADMFISASKSEGMPNGVLEALACGLPVLLSDIPQHLEILSVDKDVGDSYITGDMGDFVSKLNLLWENDLFEMGTHCRKIAEQKLSAQTMSKLYQEVYSTIKGEN